MKEESGWECICAYGWLETLSMDASKNKRKKEIIFFFKWRP